VIQLQGQVQVDDRTESRRITGAGLKELKVRSLKNGSGPVEISLWMARHGVEELQEIHTVLTAHPGPTPVLLHVQSGNGRRATIECGDHFHVRRSAELEKALAKYAG
jgi:DNA polymerase III subunit alpha